MRKSFKTFFANFATFLILFSVLVAPVQAQTSEWGGVCVGPASDFKTEKGETIDASEVATFQGLECLIANVFTVIITLIGLAGFVMFIVGSFRWMLSGSNSGGAEKARNTMTYAVVGIVVALSAFIIINLIANFTGVQTITRFIIPASDRDIPPFIMPPLAP